MNNVHFFSILSRYVEVFVVNGGYPLIFLFTLLEGIPLFGMLVPGHVAVILAGFLVKIGYLNIYIVSIVSILGAVLGDFIGFIIGKKYGMGFIDRFRPYFFITDSHIEKTNNILKKHTGKALILGRFTPMTRALTPFLVGVSDAHVKKFWFYNIVGAVSWVMSSIFLGYVFGAGYHAISKYIGKFVVASVILSLLVVWGYRFVNSRFHVFRRFELFILGLNLISLYSLAKTVQDWVSVKSDIVFFDARVSVYIVKHISPTLISIAKVISGAGGVIALETLAVVIGTYFLLKKKYRSGAIIALSTIFAGLTTGVVKEIFMSPRPEQQFVSKILTDPSFPSAHAAVAAAFFIAILYICLPKIHSWVKRELFIVVSVIIVASVGLSRIALNVHWSSDVVAGWSLGIFVATSIILLVKYMGVLMKK